ncbi:MAG: type IV pilin protein [Steroidobacteraceae bacterium]
MHPARKSAGFSMIELVVAMVVVAILAAIAIPSYSNYTLQAHRTDAKTALLDLASLEERYFSVNNSYTAVPASLGYTAFPQTVGSGYYQVQTPVVVAATTAAPATYSLQALPIGTQLAKDTQCQSFTLTSTGQQTALPDPTSSCWH